MSKIVLERDVSIEVSVLDVNSLWYILKNHGADDSYQDLIKDRSQVEHASYHQLPHDINLDVS